MNQIFRVKHGRQKCITLLATIAAVVLFSPITVTAQQSGELLRLKHSPIETNKLPSAGAMMDIKVQLENTKEIDTKIRLVGSRDGRFMDIAFPLGAFDMSDQPVFTIQVPAPVAAMTYQFIIHQKSGDLTLSEKYVIKRNCVRKQPTSDSEEVPLADFRQKSARLVAMAKTLEQDARNLDTAVQLLDTLKKDLFERDTP